MSNRYDTFSLSAKSDATEWPLVNVHYAGYRRYTCQVNITGSPTVVRIKLSVSIDGSLFSDLLDHTLTSDQLTAATGIIIPETEPCVNWIKAEVITLTGGSSPTVTIYLKVAEV